MKKRPFNTADILAACKNGEESKDFIVFGLSEDDLLHLRTWANRKGLYITKTPTGATISPSKPTTARGEIISKMSGENPFCVSNETFNYVRIIVSQFNKKNNPPTPWKVKKLSDKEFMIYREPPIPNPHLI
jgi:hypothetical protein